MHRKSARIASAAALFLCAVAAGFLTWSRSGQELLRQEIENQLARLLQGEVRIASARLVVGDGLWLKGRGIDVYPGEQGNRAGQAALSGEYAAARLDVLALLTGRLRLRELEIDGLHLRLERFADGRWSLPPLEAALAPLPAADANANRDDLEQNLSLLRASEAITRALLEGPVVANRVQLHYATIHFTDHTTGPSGGEPVEFTLRGIEGRLEHNWLADEAELSVRAQLSDPIGRRSAVELTGRRREGLNIAVAVTDLPLAMLGPYLAKAGENASADGTLSGVVSYRTPSAAHGVLELDWLIRNLDTSIPLRGDPLHVESPRLRLESRIEIHPGRVRLAELALEGIGGAGELSISGVIERPLRDSARARLSAELRGAGLMELRRMVAWLPASDAEPLTKILERLESGRIERIQATGVARMLEWRRLAQGRLESLPAGFVLSSDLADIAVATDGAAALTHLGAHAEWSGDRAVLRGLTARWNGEPLAPLDATVEGVSHLLRGPESARELRPGAEPLRGLGTLWQVLTGDKRRPDSLPAIQLAIDTLDHPALRWPVRDTQLRISPTRDGLDIEATEGTWAGAPYRAEAHWVGKPEPHWTVAIQVSPPTAESPAPSENLRADAEAATAPWFSGSLDMTALADLGLPISRLHARFAFQGATLRLDDVTGRMTQEGVLHGSLVVDLARTERLDVEVDAEMLEGDLAQIAPLVGLGRDQWSGRVSFKAGLSGWIEAERPLLAGLSGPIYVLSREGALQREIPMVLALAQATEGFNPFASRKVAVYESVEMTLELDNGRLSTQDLALDGPIRVYARGYLDVARQDPKVSAVVGVFLFRQADQTLGRVPLLSHLISDQGLVGGYFALAGSAKEPAVRNLPLNSLASVVPDVVKAPFRAIRRLFGINVEDAAPPARRAPDWPTSAEAWQDSIRHPER